MVSVLLCHNLTLPIQIQLNLQTQIQINTQIQPQLIPHRQTVHTVLELMIYLDPYLLLMYWIPNNYHSWARLMQRAPRIKCVFLKVENPFG